MPIQWTKENSVNVKELDEQHKQFIGILNSLYDAVYHVENRNQLKDILDKLTNFANLHFKTEESYFDKFNYENSEEHKIEHAKLKAQVAEFYKKFEDGKAEITVELLDFLEDWLVDHLGIQDKKYTDCFNNHGLY